MGRPLAKRFFGNRNLGSASTTNDEGIGGSRVASVTITGAGSYTTVPTVTFDPPALAGAGAVTATGTVVMKALSATVDTIGTGDTTADYVPGDVLTVSGDTGTAATFTVATVKVRTISVQAAGTTVWTTGDTVTFSAVGWATPAVITITDDGAGGIASLTITNAGSWGTSGSVPTDPVSPNSASVNDGGGYQNDATFNIGFGVNTVSVLSEGTLTALDTNPHATTTNSVSGAGATLNVTYGVKSITVTEQGSGYTNAADAAVTFSAGAATGTVVLETDGTGIYEFGTNENAITISAYLPTTAATGLISGAGGAAAKNGDIVKQVHTSRYVVENADGVGRVRLVAAAPAAGEANIIAEDSDGNTYYVIKLTRHRATVVPDSGTQFSANQSVPWTFDAATASTTVKIRNT